MLNKQTPPIPAPSLEQKIYELSFIWKEAEYNFAFWEHINARLPANDKNDPNPSLSPASRWWDAEYRKALKAVIATETLYDYFREIKKFLALLRDGHTQAYQPNEIYTSEYYSNLPVKIEYHCGQWVISNIKRSYSGTIKLWDIVSKFNGMPIQEYIEQNVFPYIWHEKLDSANWQVNLELTSGAEGSVVTLEIDGEVHTLERTFGDKNWLVGNKLTAPEAVKKEYDSETHTIEITSDNIAIITIDDFGYDNLPDEIYANYSLLEKAKGFIIDIRNNGGGNSSNGDAVAALFFKKTFSGGHYKLPAHIGYYKANAPYLYDDGQQWVKDALNVGKRSFYHLDEPIVRCVKNYDPPGLLRQPVVLLTTAETGSAAEDFAISMLPRGTIVGTPTTGSTGQPIFYTLDSGVTFRICTQYCKLPCGGEYINHGVQPHIHFEPSLDERKTGIDTHLAKGLEVLRNANYQKSL